MWIRIDHWCSVVPEKYQPLGPPFSGELGKVSKAAKIRNRYNQVPHLTKDTNGKVTSLVSHWNGWPSGWDYSVPPEHI